jgi:hypothetical protein
MQPARSNVTGGSSPCSIFATTGPRAFIIVGAPEVSQMMSMSRSGGMPIGRAMASASPSAW